MESNSGFVVDAGFILGMVGNYLVLGIFIQRAVGKERCGGALCTYQASHHPGIEGSHSSIAWPRRLAIIVGWLPWFVLRVIRFVFQTLGWTISRFRPRRIWMSLCVTGRAVRWTVQGT